MPVAAQAAEATPQATVIASTKKMERTIERFMDRWEIKGASFAVMKDGKLLYSKGFGIADSASGDSVNVGNIFRIASRRNMVVL